MLQGFLSEPTGHFRATLGQIESRAKKNDFHNNKPIGRTSSLSGVARKLVLKERLNAPGNVLKALSSSYQQHRLDSSRLISSCYLQIFTTLHELERIPCFSVINNFQCPPK